MPAAVDVPLALISLFGALHVLGEQRATRLLGRPRSNQERWRAGSFYAALLVILGALASPIDSLSEKLFWVHMIQHVMLLGIAAPLIVLGAPWMSIWRPLPLGMRRTLAKTIARAPWCAPLRALGVLARPTPAWIAFSVDLVLWHIPFFYDAAVANRAIHDLEHTTFLVFGILLWAQVIDSPPLRARLSQIHRVYYIVAASVVGWLIALVLVFASSPLYPRYAHLAHRPGGISALTDQQLAGGIMLVPGSFAMTLFVFFQIYRWLGIEERDDMLLVKGRRLGPPSPPPAGGSNGANGNGTRRETELPVTPTVEV
ncbi:MAG TPA: cytochrome c oxidase assembly protein [Solirubrobacteraceae bacterium]|nr:cytochrome c oxidase assembly protein [Solirubrobacteraceae bacterium]